MNFNGFPLKWPHGPLYFAVFYQQFRLKNLTTHNDISLSLNDLGEKVYESSGEHLQHIFNV